MVRSGIAPLDDDLLRPERYILTELGDDPASVHMDFLDQEQSFFNDKAFLNDRNNHRVAIVPDVRCGIDHLTDRYSLDLDFHRFKRLFDQFGAFAGYRANTYAITFYSPFADLEFFFDNRNAYIFDLVFRCVGHDACPIRTGRAGRGLSAPRRPPV